MPEQIESFGTCQSIDECLRFLYSNEYKYDWAIGASRLNIVNSPFYSSSKFFCFDQSEGIENYPVSMGMRKDYGKDIEVNKVIRYLTEGGFFVKWHRDNVKRKMYEVPITVSSFMTMDRLWVIFGLWGIGCLIPISSFCLELIVHKMVYQRNARHWIWINLDHMCDGCRHNFRDSIK